MLKRICFTIACLLVISISQAQILNIEKQRLDQDTTKKWLGSASFFMNIQKQQGLIQVYELDGNLAKLTKKNAYILIGDINFIKARGTEVSRRGFAHGRAIFRRKPKLKPEMFGQWQYDVLRGMQERRLGGAGLRYRIFSKDKSFLAIGTSAMYEFEQWAFEGQDRTLELWKSSTYASWYLKTSETSYFNGAMYFQAPFNGLTDPRVSADAYFNIKILKKLEFVLKYNIWYDDKPVIDIENTTYSFSSGIKINL